MASENDPKPADGAPLTLPCFLPNPQRVLLGALDKWLQTTSANFDETQAVVHALQEAVCECGAGACQPRLESIPYLIASEDMQITTALRSLAMPAQSTRELLQ